MVNSISCIKVLDNSQIAEAWQFKEGGDSAGFYIHLLTDDGTNFRFYPPLKIPYEMMPGEYYNYVSRGYFKQGGHDYYFDVNDSLLFEGFVSKTVNAGTFEDALKIKYDVSDPPNSYYEYYGKGVGLLDNEDYILDSAYIDGVWYR